MKIKTLALAGLVAFAAPAQATTATTVYTKSYSSNDSCRQGILSAVLAAGSEWVNAATEIVVEGADLAVVAYVYDGHPAKRAYLFTCTRGQLKLQEVA